mgnify:CR=1 FL=1
MEKMNIPKEIINEISTFVQPKYKCMRVKYTYTTMNYGTDGDTGFKIKDGEKIFIIDDDDKWEDTHIRGGHEEGGDPCEMLQCIVWDSCCVIKTKSKCMKDNVILCRALTKGIGTMGIYEEEDDDDRSLLSAHLKWEVIDIF